MPKIERVKDEIRIYTEFRERDLVKLVPGTRWNTETKVWTAPLSWGSCVSLRGVFGQQLEVGDRLVEWAREEWADRIGECMELRTYDSLDGQYSNAARRMLLEDFRDRRGWPLYPFQLVNMAFLTLAERALLADEMGLGKTVSMIATLRWWASHNEDALPALVVCTNTMKRTWASEFLRWAPDLRVVVVGGTKQERLKQIRMVEEGDADVLIVNWEALRFHSRLAGYGSIRLADEEKRPKELNGISWRAVIADEAHKAKNPRAKQTRALWALAHDARYRIAMTGTPVANAPDDLWSIMHVVAPEDWPRKTAFVDRYCMQSWNSFGGMSVVGIRPDTRDEFYKILDPRFIRHLKMTVLRQLPPKTYQTRYVEMTPKQKRAYERIRDQMLAELDSGDVMYVTNPLAKATRLSQLASSYAELDGNDVKLAEPSCKVDALVDLVEELDGAPVVAFAESRQLIELCEARLTKLKIPYVSIHGRIPEPDRIAATQRFQAGEVPVLLATLGAGGEGLTFTRAATAVFLQRSWSMLKNVQAEDRIHRIGQESDTVEIIEICTVDTLEEYRALRLKEKEDMLQEVVRDKEVLRELLAHGRKRKGARKKNA